MNIQEIRQLNGKKIFAGLRKARRELAVTRFHARTGQNQNTAKIRSLRKTIARFLTVIRNEKNNSSSKAA